RPISATLHGKSLYVLNAGGAGNVTGFTVGRDSLTPLAGSTQPLAAGSSGPAQVSFNPSGDTLVVTEKGSHTIDTYAVGSDRRVGAPFSAVGRRDAVRLRLRQHRRPARRRHWACSGLATAQWGRRRVGPTTPCSRSRPRRRETPAIRSRGGTRQRGGR